MTGTLSRMKKLESRCESLNRRSLDTLVQQVAHLVRNTGLRFEDAVDEVVRDLNKQELESIIAEAVSRYGREIVSNRQAL
jgi:hypothetical protein